MSLTNLQEKLPDYAKDIRINLAQIMSETGSPGLHAKQIAGVALASAYVTKNSVLISDLIDFAKENLAESEINAVKAATVIMAMNNIYYRFNHLTEDKEFSQMPANLRMTVIGNPGIAKEDFEMYALAVSILNGCGYCIDAHINALLKKNISKAAIHSIARISSVVNAAAQALEIK